MITRILKIPKSQSFFLFGPRGSGKSTLLKSIFNEKGVTWIDLLHQATELKLSTNPDSLIDQWKAKRTEWIVIDEVQKIPKILDVVHKSIEEYNIKFALTGSSARKLKRGGANLLAGRAVEKKLGPFTASELGDDFDLLKSLKFGMLPAVWTKDFDDEENTDFLYAYVNTYLKEEIAAEQLVRNLEPFRRFLVAAAQSNGKIINHAAIERDCGVSGKQSQRHFEILADTLVGQYLEPFHTSTRKRQTLKSKFYFYDTGIVRTLQNLAGESLRLSTYEYGNLFETFLINEFFKLSAALNKRWKFSYLRTQNDREIDLIIEKPRGKPILIEIKSTEKISFDQISSYIHLSSSIDAETVYVLSNDTEAKELENVRCLHWKEGLEEIFAN